MRRRPSALLLALLLPQLLACQRTPVELTDQQRAACRSEAESAATAEEALKRNADCLAATLQAQEKPPAPTPPPAPTAPPARTASPAAAAAIDRYRYCRVHQEDVQAASARLSNAAKPLMLAAKQFSPDSEQYRAALQAHAAAVAELERLLPPEIRNGMDLLPTAAEAYSRCDRKVLEGTSGP